MIGLDIENRSTGVGFCVLIISILSLFARPAGAVPAFAAQTGQPCQTCHVGGFGPQLTPFGRDFKLRGYTQRVTAFSAPISAMAMASYLRTARDQAAPPAPGFARNDNSALDQASLFIAGGLGAHLGAFIQTTYDGIAKAWTWDNLDVRATTDVQIKSVDAVLGVSLNNSPTVQDAWNTLPAWGFPYTASALAPSPAASPLLEGALAQTSLGLTGYAWINGQVLVEGGAYGSPGASTLTRLGADPTAPGDIAGLAPYGRVAWQTPFRGGTLELGAVGLRGEIHPGLDRSTGLTDRYTDLGADASYIRTLASGDVVTVNGRYLHEARALNATCALAGVAVGCAHGSLDKVQADASYYWRNRIGGSIQLFDILGPANPVAFAGARTARPDSSGVTLQLDATPFGDRPQPGRRVNVRVGVQYTAFAGFNGARRNFDGAGTNASDNDSFRVFTWFAF